MFQISLYGVKFKSMLEDDNTLNNMSDPPRLILLCIFAIL